MARKKGVNWNVADKEDGPAYTVEHAQLATLMDIRDELENLNATLLTHLRPGMKALVRIDKRLSKVDLLKLRITE